MTATLRRATWSCALLLSAACGSDAVQPVVPAGSTVVVSGGNTQSVTVATAASVPLAVLVEDAAGQPLAGVPVSWVVSSGGGSLAPATSQTDAAGVATTTYTAGSTAGAKTIDAVVHGATGSPLAFQLTAVPGPARRLVKTSGDLQQGQVGQFPLPLAVTVVDSFGNGVGGTTVTWTAGAGGSVSPATATSEGTGRAITLYTAASLGAHSVTAASAGLSGSPVTFSETAVGTITLVKELAIPANYGLHDQFVRAGLAFLCAWNTGLEIYDVGDGRAGGTPANPVRLGGVVTNGGEVHNAWWYWAPNGDKRYVFVGQEGPGAIGSSSSGDIHVLDVTNMASPVEVAFFRLAGAGVHNFWVDEVNQILYAAYYNGGVVALNIAGTLSGDLASRVIANVRPGGAGNTYVWGVQLYNGSLYATDMISGFYQLNAATLTPLGGGGNVPERYGSDQWVANGFAYSGTWGSRVGGIGNAVKVWQLSASGAPVLVDSIITPGISTVSDVEVTADNRMLMFSAEGGSSRGIYFYSLVGTPSRPTFLAYYPVTSGGTNGVHTATFAEIGGRLYVFAARDPSAPSLLILDVTAIRP